MVQDTCSRIFSGLLGFQFVWPMFSVNLDVAMLNLLFLVTILLSASGEIISYPRDVTAFSGHKAPFICTTDGSDTSWMYSIQPDLADVEHNNHSLPIANLRLFSLNITARSAYNGTMVGCVPASGDLQQSATLYVQDTLPSVETVEGKSNSSSITVSWSAPFSLDVTGVNPDIWYSVLIYNVTDNPTAISCTDCTDITETHYTFTPDYPSPCHKYIFTVIPLNGAGQGHSSETVTESLVDYPQYCDTSKRGVIQWEEHIQLTTSCTRAPDVMIIVERDSEMVVTTHRNIQTCSEFQGAKKILLYEIAESGGLPLNGSSPDFIWSSFVEFDEDFTSDRGSSEHYLHSDNMGVTSNCTNCTLLCLAENHVLIFGKGPVLPLPAGSYWCTVITESESRVMQSVNISGFTKGNDSQKTLNVWIPIVGVIISIGVIIAIGVIGAIGVIVLYRLCGCARKKQTVQMNGGPVTNGTMPQVQESECGQNDVTFPMPKEVAVENGSSYDIVLPETKRSTAPTPATQAPVKDRPVYMKPSESVIPSDSYYHGNTVSQNKGEMEDQDNNEKVVHIEEESTDSQLLRPEPKIRHERTEGKTDHSRLDGTHDHTEKDTLGKSPYTSSAGYSDNTTD